MRTKQEIETAFAPRASLAGRKSFFLVGIGGAGMSGVARMLSRRGFRVRGTDSTDSEVVRALREDGVEIWIGHSGDFVERGDALVLTDAIPLEESPEVAAARGFGNPLFRRSQVLGWLLEGQRTIAVTGSHGKTTTTGMIGAGLRASGLDPTIVVGAEVPDFGGAIVEGQGGLAVVEACEAYDSLRDFDPYIVVLTNLELDHVDFHGDWQGLRRSMEAFLSRIVPGGTLVYCAEDPGSREVAEAVAAEHGVATVAYTIEDSRLPELALPGRHNALNATGALVACERLGADPARAAQGIAAYRGAERRLQTIATKPLVVIDDYAHHPTEIVASLQAVRERWLPGAPEPGGPRLVVVYQPHLYSRTAPLIAEFAAALSQADFVVLTDIYPAREAPIPGVSSWRIAEQVTKPCQYVPQRHLLPREVAKVARPGDVVVGMGAGNIASFAPDFAKELERGSPERVAVLYGGDSAEREISLLSGREVAAALRRRGYTASLLDVSELLLSGQSLAKLAGPARPDVCFLAVHGSRAEDGAIQGLLELLHLPYTGSGIAASAVALDKDRTKTVLAAAGLPVPEGLAVCRDKHGEPPLPKEGAGWVVKPNKQGSTVGLRFVEEASELAAAVAYALQFDEVALVEDWVRGVEVSVPVLGAETLPVVEIVPASGAYDFASKYTAGATDEICPARLTPEQTALCQDYALRAHHALGCAGCTRTDMIVTPERVVVLEVNTLPGMTQTSLVPRSAAVAGIDFDDLCVRIVQDALNRSKA
ncbi:MAG: D-alanine--D-alanine ligase [Fimbriimonadaceae bacterium]|nr:D-alanine--D-alanine ligase [Fimbriimonadaceae bacterium]QYK55280.1 MAG: D-alanine--D-alanine ligase [Fimbriimonadaceae bacterium]